MDTTDCPFCDTEFKVQTWESGECPNCHEKYYWDEFGDMEYGYDVSIMWEKIDKVHNGRYLR